MCGYDDLWLHSSAENTCNIQQRWQNHTLPSWVQMRFHFVNQYYDLVLRHLLGKSQINTVFIPCPDQKIRNCYNSPDPCRLMDYWYFPEVVNQRRYLSRLKRQPNWLAGEESTHVRWRESAQDTFENFENRLIWISLPCDPVA